LDGAVRRTDGLQAQQKKGISNSVNATDINRRADPAAPFSYFPKL